MKISKNHCQSNGYGILELVITSAITAVVVTAGAVLFMYFLRNYNFSFEESRILGEAEATMREMTTEIREAKVGENGAYPLAVASDQEIRFYSDMDEDGETEKIRYFLEGEVLKKGVIEPSSPPIVYNDAAEVVSTVSSYIVNGADPVFYYFNSGWPGDTLNNPLIPAERLLETRLIRINISINTYQGQDVDDFKLATEVMVRNLKTN